MTRDSDTEIRTLLDKGPFALVGAGQLGEMALDLWPKHLPRPKFLLDSTRRGKCRDVDVFSLQSHTPDPAVTYLLSAFKISADQAEKFFSFLGQERLLTVYDFFEHHCPSLFSNGWRCLNPTQEKLDEIARARACFSDEDSRSAFDAAVAWRYYRELPAGLSGNSEDDKYNLKIYGNSGSSYDIVYDCGAYDLSLAKSLVNARVSFSRYVAFEPDPGTYRACGPIAAALQQQTGVPVSMEQIALSDCDGEGMFVANGLLSSRLVDPDTESARSAAVVRVKTERLDNYHLRHFGETTDQNVLIKLHVEGAELSVLHGAVNLIDALSPDLFANLSHNEASLLEVPVFLAESNKYDLYLRAHSLFGEGLTLFARNKLRRA